MQDKTLKAQIKRKLPDWLRDDPAFRSLVMDLAREEFADKRQTEGRFEAMLAQLARDREEQTRKWDEQHLDDDRCACPKGRREAGYRNLWRLARRRDALAGA